MTVSSTTAKVTLAGNDSTTTFNFSFTIYANTDLVVTFTNSSGVESTLTEGTGTSNYSVSVSNYPGSGSITWPASGSTKLQSNEKITIKRVLPLTQTIDLQNQGGYFPDVQEQGFDRGVYISQQIDEEVDRSIKIPVSSATSIDATLPAPTADTVIGAWNSDADAIVAGPTVANISAAEANAAAAAASAVTAAAEASAANPKYTFSTTTSMADPGAGTLRYNHGTVASVSAIAIDDTTADTGNPDIEAWIASWDDSTSTVKGWLRLVEPGTPANYAVFHITGLTNNSGWVQLAVTHIDSNGTFGNGDSIRVMFSRTGDKGDTGAQGIQGDQGDEAGVLPYVFATSTSDADPGAGKLRFNNGTLSSVSQIFIDDQSNSSGNPDVSALLLTWDDSTNVTDKGTIVVSKKSALQNYFIGRLTSLVDASGYVKLVVTHVTSNGSFSADDDLLVEFQRTGNAGSLDDPMTTRGDIIVRNSSNTTARLAVGSANTVLKSDGTDISWGYTVGTSANNLVQLNGSGALPAISGENLTNLPASGGTVDLVADGAITAGKPVAITPDGKVKQISATGYSMTESIGSTVATSSRNANYAYLVFDEGNNEVLSGISITGNMYFARVTLDASMNTTYTGELTYATGGSSDAVSGISMAYNPVLDRIWCGPIRGSNCHGYLLRNNSGTLSGTASDSFGAASAYGSVDVNRSTGAMYISAPSSATSGESGVGFADLSISEVVKAHNTTDLHTGNYGQSYCYYSGFRHIPDVGLIHMRYIYDHGIEFQFLTSEQWNKDQDGAYNSSSLTGGTIARYSKAPTANSTSSPDRTVQVVSDSGTGQPFYPSTSQWHPWAKRLLIPGRSRTGSARTISTISFQNGQAEMSYGVGLSDMSYMSYNGPHFVPIPGTNAFVVVYYDSSDGNKLSYRTIDIKLGRTASEDDFVVSAARQIDTNSFDKCAAVWDQNRNAMVVSANHTSEQRFYGVKPELAVSNARNFIGFASASVSDTQTLTVHLPGAINENQSNLTVGRKYLVGHDGNLIEADNNPDKSQGMPFTGTAISATKIMVGA